MLLPPCRGLGHPWEPPGSEGPHFGGSLWWGSTHSLQSASSGPLSRGKGFLLAPRQLRPLVLVLGEVVGLLWGGKKRGGGSGSGPEPGSGPQPCSLSLTVRVAVRGVGLGGLDARDDLCQVREAGAGAREHLRGGGEGVRDVPPTTRGTRMGDVGWVRRWKGTGGGMGRALGQVPCSPCHLRTPRPPLLTSMRLLS